MLEETNAITERWRAMFKNHDCATVKSGELGRAPPKNTACRWDRYFDLCSPCPLKSYYRYMSLVRSRCGVISSLCLLRFGYAQSGARNPVPVLCKMSNLLWILRLQLIQAYYREGSSCTHTTNEMLVLPSHHLRTGQHVDVPPFVMLSAI